MSAMSAMEHPALRSGRITRWWSPVSTSADSAMKCTPQNTMSVAAVVVRGEAGQLEGVAAGIGPLDDLVPLVVVAQDQEPIAERRLGVGDPGVELVGRREGVAVRQRSLQSQHVESPEGCGVPLWPAGTAWSPTAGLSATEPMLCRCSRPAGSSLPSNPARLDLPARPGTGRVRRTDGHRARQWGCAAAGALHHPRLPRLLPVQGRRRPRASTWARRRACAAG